MKICYFLAGEFPPAAFHQSLESVGYQLTEIAAAALGESGCELCLLVLSSELDESVATIREYRRQLTPSIPLIACGPWMDHQTAGAILAAGADDYLPFQLETQQIDLRLHIFLNQHAGGQNIAEREPTDEQLVKAHRLETLASLTGSVAHDFNNLLSAVQGNAELALMDMTLDAPVRYSLEQINSAAHRAAEITRQILAFRGKPGAAMAGQPINLSQLIREMGQLLRVAVARNCKLDFRLGSALPLVAGDPLGLRQLVMTLVTSACRLAGPGGGGIQVSTSQLDGVDAAKVVLEIQYTPGAIGAGAAAPPGDGSSAESGLAAVRVIAREHGAEIIWEGLDAGGKYRMVFPATALQATPHEAQGLFGEPGTSPGTILLIDDEEAVRVAAHRLLRRAGYTVFEAGTGEEGLAVTAQIASALDAVLVDLNMPGLACRDLLEQLRRLRSDLRLVVWSGFPEEAAREQLGGLPNILFIEKPTQLGELVGMLQRVLKN